MVLDIIGGLLLGGGGGGGGATSYSVTSTIRGGSPPVGVTSTLQGGDRPVEVAAGLDDVNIDVGGTGTPVHGIAEVRVPDTVRGETDLDIAVTRPVEVESHLDIEPVVVDLCVDVGLTQLPRSRIQQPYTGQIGLTVLGLELVGLRWCGQAETVVDDLEPRPHHELGGVTAAAPRRASREGPAHRPRDQLTATADRGGLQVRLP